MIDKIAEIIGTDASYLLDHRCDTISKNDLHLPGTDFLVNPLALMGVMIAYFRPRTKFPHAGHVLLSTWASLFHIIMALGQKLNFVFYIVILLFLFFAVWIPCCISDIVFPLLFVKENN